MKDFRSQAHLLQAPGAEVLDQHLGAFGQAEQDVDGVRLAQIQGQALLVAGIDLPVAIHPAILPGAQRIALAGGLDLDDLGPEVGQLQAQHVAGDQPRKVEHADARERAQVVGIEAEVHQRVPMGVPGEPTAPGMRSGGAVSR